jgi:hypothetical protein
MSIFSGWSSAATTEAEKSKEAPKRITRETYVPVVLDDNVVPVRANDTLVENARMQQRIWGHDLENPHVNPLHFACLMGNPRTLHTFLSKGFHCPRSCMNKAPSGITPLLLISSQMDDKTASFCTEMFCEALEACDRGYVEPRGKFGYVACVDCFKNIANKPVACASEAHAPVLQDTNDTTP